MDVTKIMQGTANDVPLFDGDILVLPDSKGKRATARALEAALQFGLIAGSYAIFH